MSLTMPADTTGGSVVDLSFVWLEITGKCQLECVHCYAESGPGGVHGSMTTVDWLRLVDECAAAGVEMVQFIGGEPTLHPALPDLIEHALGRDLEVEVFSNLVHVSPRLWEIFERPGVRLACSWYSEDPGEHELIVQRPTHARTKANLAEAVRRGIPVRAGVIGMLEGQDVDAAAAELAEVGVTDVGVDHLRQVGRGIRDREASVKELCGNCGDGVVAVGPDGSVWPCVFSRWMSAGNVHDAALVEIVTGQAMAERRAELGFTSQQCDHEHEIGVGEEIVACRPSTPCAPACAPRCHPRCGPACNPNCGPKCSPSCQPCGPGRRCWPFYEGRK